MIQVTRMTRNTRFGRTAAGGAALLAALAVLAAPAFAQSNSLFGQGRSVANAAPANGRAARPAPPARYVAGGPLVDGGAGTTFNPSLLNTSLYVVQFPEMRRIQVNDLITVIVREDRRAISDAKLKQDRKMALAAELTAWMRINSHNKLVPQDFPEGNPKAAFGYDTKFDGKGKHERTDTLVTRIAVKVIDIKPNGNLIVQGRKELRVGEEVQVATITGECTADDVTPQRTVLSTQIYDLRIDMPDQGAMNAASRRGWLLKLIDAARPF